VESSRESRIRIEGNEILKATPEGDVVLLRAPLRVGTAWTQHVVEYTPQAGWRRHELRCRIAMIETVPVFGRDRLTIRIVGRAMLPLGEVVVTEQHATDIGLVLRRERMGDLGASEIVLEEIRGALDRRADR
jgi:hypothetical protein